MAGFPGFVVMTTKPPLYQTRQRFAFTDSNGHTNAVPRAGMKQRRIASERRKWKRDERMHRMERKE